MTKEQVQTMAFEIVMEAGDALNCFYSAVTSYKKSRLQEAAEQLKAGKQHLIKTHQIQTDLIQAEANNEDIPYSLIMVHAQDHLSTAMNWERMAQLLIVDLNEELD